jgi:pantoate--beta-alanine ligase
VDSCSGVDELRRHTREWRVRGLRVAFVPTMGNLHAGHLALVQHARAVADRLVVSIFVNPLQFAPGEDYAGYPSTPAADRAALAAEGTDLLFAPTVDEMYPDGQAGTTVVVVPALNSLLEGEFRPTHMDGVATVVARLFGMVQPDVAVFGEKDYQQLLLVRRMVRDLCLPVEVAAVETVRETDGLAMSSRNSYLSAHERAIAPALYRQLCAVRAKVEGGARDFPAIESGALAALTEAGFRPDYLRIRNARDLGEAVPGERELRVLAAARLGRTRLIDNIGISIS